MRVIYIVLLLLYGFSLYVYLFLLKIIIEEFFWVGQFSDFKIVWRTLHQRSLPRGDHILMGIQEQEVENKVSLLFYRIKDKKWVSYSFSFT